MNSWFGRVVLMIVIAVGAAASGYWYGAHHATEEKKDADEAGATTQPAGAEDEVRPVAEVVVEPIRKGKITQTVTAYGSVVAEAGDVRIVSIGFETRIGKILVTPGQQVAADTELLVADASPDAIVALQDAKNAYEAATRDLAQAQQRFNDHLATNQELSQAQQAVTSAKLKLNSLVERGVDTPQRPTAGAAGLVSKVDVQEGQIVPAGGALVEIAAGNKIEVKLGVQPGDAAALKPDQPVRVHLVSGTSGDEFEGHIRVIGQRVDSATHLVDVRVTLPTEAKLLLDSFVVATLERASADDALLAPRDAVLPDEEGKSILYTVANDKAVKHLVKVGLENDNQTQVIADDLKEGDPIVVRGNYELDDGMDVKIAAEAPATEPTTGPTTESKP
jgi:membrane fusion protein (multidrug efflux system)